MMARVVRRRPPSPARPAEQLPVAIRLAQDADAPRLRELAALDSATPPQGTLLVAVIEERIWAALAIDEDRAVADPFLPTAHAVEMLRLRGRQLRDVAGRHGRRTLPRRLAGRARA